MEKLTKEALNQAFPMRETQIFRHGSPVVEKCPDCSPGMVRAFRDYIFSIPTTNDRAMSGMWEEDGFVCEVEFGCKAELTEIKGNVRVLCVQDVPSLSQVWNALAYELQKGGPVVAIRRQRKHIYVALR